VAKWQFGVEVVPGPLFLSDDDDARQEISARFTPSELARDYQVRSCNLVSDEWIIVPYFCHNSSK
jgi:hypothetical protein